MKTIKHRLNNEAALNISSLPNVEITNCPCKIHINNKHEITLPLLVILANSTKFTQEFSTDVTTRDFYVTIESFNTSSSNEHSSLIQKIEDFLSCREVTFETPNEIIEFAKFGKSIGNTSFVSPFEELCQTLDNNLNENNVIESLCQKVTLELDSSKYSREVSILSTNFVDMKDDIVSLSHDIKYIDAIRSIVSSPSLRLESEDDLLLFVSELCSVNLQYSTLFPFVHLEYCSVSCVVDFVSFVDTNIVRDIYTSSVLQCLRSRLCQPSRPMKPSFIKDRHKPTFEYFFEEITDSDPLNGILRREGTKGNVLLSNPCNDDWSRLIKADDSFNYYSTAKENYYIEASLKDHKSFIITKYMLRWRPAPKTSSYNHLNNWKLEGLRKSDNKWIELDHQENKAMENLQFRVFPVSCSDELISVKLTQTSVSTNGGHYLGINAFDIFGHLHK